MNRVHTGNLAHHCPPAGWPLCSTSTGRPNWVSVAERSATWAEVTLFRVCVDTHNPAAAIESSRAAADSSPTSPGHDLDAARWLMREVSRCRLSTAHGAAWPATRLHRSRDIDTVVVMLTF